MKHKKLIALLATSVMAMSSMTVCADSLEGNINWVDKTIYKVVLPTTEGMSFTLDPQGLTALDAEDGDINATAGSIVSTGTMTAKNWSSVAVTLTASFYVTDTNATSVTLVGKDDTLDNENTEMQLIITADDTDATELYVTGTADNDTSDASFTMDAANYEFTGNATDGYAYELVENAEASVVNLTIGGSVAKEADWSAYVGDEAKKITLNAVFKFTNDDDDELPADAIITEDAVVPATDNYVMLLGDDGSVSYTFVEVPEGTLTALTSNGSNRAAAITNGNITYEDGTLTFNATAVSKTLTTGTNTIVATIGDANYTLTYVAE